MIFFFLLLSSVCFGSYHSQVGQDKYLNENVFKNKRGGIFVDIGAHDGITFSNTYFYEKELGWSGLCIEPMPHIFEKLQKNRSCKLFRGCISEEHQTKKSFLHVQCQFDIEMLSGIIDKYPPQHLKRISDALQAWGGTYEITTIETLNLNHLLKESAMTHVDLLSIDTEGGEYEILKSINFSDFQIDTISVEDNYGDSRMIPFLESKGYKLLTRLEQDLIFISERIAKPYIALTCSPYGLFSLVEAALSLGEAYEKGVIVGGHIDFKTNGLYYDPKRGENWWEYYFEPIRLGELPKENPILRSTISCYQIELCNSREENKALLDKYIRVKPPIQAKADDFFEAHFKGKYVIGLHYRGTDKGFEAPPVAYENVQSAIEKCIEANKEKNWVLFVATDDQKCLDFILKKFPNRVVYLSHVARSMTGNPTHINYHGFGKWEPVPNCYENGENAVIDCLLLSKCDFLIRTSSNLSYIASCMNPQLPMVELNHRIVTKDGLPLGFPREVLERSKNKDPALYFID